MEEWITNEEDIKNLILLDFQEISQTDLVEAPHEAEVQSFSCCFLSEEEKALLAAPVLEEEIRQGLWSLKAFKALGPNRLHTGLFQYFWQM